MSVLLQEVQLAEHFAMEDSRFDIGQLLQMVAEPFFDLQELELVICGMPTIKINDWKAQT